MPDQEQADKIEQCRLFGIIHFERFESRRDCLEHLLIIERNSHKGGINGTDVTTHKIGARTLTQVGKVCRHDFQIHSGPASEAWYKDIVIREF